jgi:superfamily II DNA/RNA helicase
VAQDKTLVFVETKKNADFLATFLSQKEVCFSMDLKFLLLTLPLAQ